jgi:hypothetical protein
MACWLKAIFGGQGGHRINAATLLAAARPEPALFPRVRVRRRNKGQWRDPLFPA